MDHVVFYDCEFLTAPGAPTRFWCGPLDPDPLCVQIGAVRMALTPPFAISDRVGWYVRPVDRDGMVVAVHPLLTRLTGITDDLLRTKAVPLVDALGALSDFAAGAPLLSWGKDDLLTLAATLFVQETPCPIPAAQFRNATPLLLPAGEPADTICTLRSNTICAHFGLDQPGPEHDARADAEGVARAFQHLMRTGRLKPENLHVMPTLDSPRH